MAHSDDAHGLALQLKAHQAVLGLALTAALLHRRQISAEGQRHAQRQLRHCLVGIAGGVADLHAHLPHRRQVHMVHPGKGHVDVLQLPAGADHLAAQRHIGNDQRVRILRLPDQRLRIGRPRILLKHMPLRLKGRLQRPHLLIRHRKGFQNHDFAHCSTSFKLRNTPPPSGVGGLRWLRRR